MPKRQVILQRAEKDSDGVPMPLGQAETIIEMLAPYNTAPDGSPPGPMGTLFLYGPGMIVELPTSFDEVNQALASVHEEQTAWPVLTRLCRNEHLVMTDVDSGMVFNFSSDDS